MALNVRHGMALADCHAEVLRVIARALRAADARGYQRAQDEFKRITDAVWPMVEKDASQRPIVIEDERRHAKKHGRKS
jgi:hypothetical protein